MELISEVEGDQTPHDTQNCEGVQWMRFAVNLKQWNDLDKVHIQQWMTIGSS